MLPELNSWLCVTFPDILWVRLQGSSARYLPPSAFSQWWPQWTNIPVTGEYRGGNEWSQAHTPVLTHAPTSIRTHFQGKALFSSGQRWRWAISNQALARTHVTLSCKVLNLSRCRHKGDGAALSIFHQFFMHHRPIKWQPLGSSSAAFPPHNRDSLQINTPLLLPALPSSFQT